MTRLDAIKTRVKFEGGLEHHTSVRRDRAWLLARLDEARELLDGAGITHDDPRLDYLDVQLDRVPLTEWRTALDEEDG